jgi:hypothetical protein
VDNNSKAATPVNLEGVGPGFPGLPVDATIVAPLPLPVLLASPLPVPVQIQGVPYGVKRQAGTGGLVQTQQLVSIVPCELNVCAGYNRDPSSATQLWVQLHDAAALVLPGALPAVTFPVYGGNTPFSYAVDWAFAVGLVVAISTSELAFAAPAGNYLGFSATYRTAA